MARRNLSKLMESELDKAEAILAVKGLGSEIQSMTEKVAKMRVDDLLPLVERVKEVFGIQEGETLQQTVDSALETLQNNLTEAKDTVDNSALVLNGEAPPGDTDMGMPGDDLETEMDFDSEVPTDDELDGDMEDPFGAADENVADDEPLGRVKKESVKRKGRRLSENKRTHLLKKLKVLEGKIKKARRVKSK